MLERDPADAMLIRRDAADKMAAGEAATARAGRIGQRRLYEIVMPSFFSIEARMVTVS